MVHHFREKSSCSVLWELQKLFFTISFSNLKTCHQYLRNLCRMYILLLLIDLGKFAQILGRWNHWQYFQMYQEIFWTNISFLKFYSAMGFQISWYCSFVFPYKSVMALTLALYIMVSDAFKMCLTVIGILGDCLLFSVYFICSTIFYYKTSTKVFGGIFTLKFDVNFLSKCIHIPFCLYRMFVDCHFVWNKEQSNVFYLSRLS